MALLMTNFCSSWMAGDDDGSRVNTIVIQKYDENLGRVLGKTRYGVREKGLVLRIVPVGRKGRIFGSMCSAI